MIYLDNSATTPVSAAVKKTVLETVEIFGNPSSLHSAGGEAEKVLTSARASVMTALGGSKDTGEIVFTSCGSEATSLALFGTAHAKERRTANRILTTDSEHPSVENVLRALEKEGFDVVRLPTRGGVIDEEALEKALGQPIFLATFMLVNNETGARYAVERAFAAIRKKWQDALLHVDAVQGFLRVPFTVKSLGADMVTVSAHKIHALKGTGALWIRKDLIRKKQITPFLLGGGQEKGLRSGTENTVGIAAFGTAAEEGFCHRDEAIEKMVSLRKRAEDALASLPVRVNVPQKDRAPHILSVTVPGFRSETLVHFLSARDVFVSGGSACSAHSGKVSSTLLAFGLTPDEADSTLRVSLSAENTEEEIDAFVSALREAVTTLIPKRR